MLEAQEHNLNKATPNSTLAFNHNSLSHTSNKILGTYLITDWQLMTYYQRLLRAITFPVFDLLYSASTNNTIDDQSS